MFALPVYARRCGWRREDWFLVGWIAPPALFYMLVHFGQAGYVLTFLPALVILLRRALVEAAAAGSDAPAPPRTGAGPSPPARWSPLLLINTGFFVNARPMPREFDRPPGQTWLRRARDDAHDWILSRTAAALREHEAVIRTYVETIRAVYEPDDTALITEIGNRRSYPVAATRDVLPARVRRLPALARRGPRLLRAPVGGHDDPHARRHIALPRRVRQLVWFVDHWDPA